VAAHDIDVARQETAAALDAFINPLRTALGPVGDQSAQPLAAAPADPARSLAAARHLMALLAEFDPAAGEFVEANRSVLRPLFDDGKWTDFEKLISDYSFSEAQTEIGEALKRFSAQ
jgi:hypothetical protein